MAMIGLPKSSSVIPVARQRARAPAIFLPWVEVFDLYSGISLFNLLMANFVRLLLSHLLLIILILMVQ